MDTLLKLEADMIDIRNSREIKESKAAGNKIKVGDEVGAYFGGGTLVGTVIEIQESGLCICQNKLGKSKNDTFSWLEKNLYLIRKDKPMFKTDDGVMLYEGDSFYWATKDGGLTERIAAPCNDTPLYKQFSTKELAEAYLKTMYVGSSLGKTFTKPIKKSFFKRLFNIP